MHTILNTQSLQLRENIKTLKEKGMKINSNITVLIMNLHFLGYFSILEQFQLTLFVQ